MKIYIIGKLFKDALYSMQHNITPSLAGIFLSFIAFVSFGAAVSIYYNVEHNIERIQERPELEIFIYSDASAEELEWKLNQMPGVISIEFIDKDKAFLRAKELIGEDSEVLDNLGKDFLPESFLVDIDNMFKMDDVVKEIESFVEVESMNYSDDEIRFINKISSWSQYLTLLVFALTLIFAFSIISMLVRVTVYARKREIKVKKFLGADKIFILLPFIFEGVIISLIGAISSWCFIIVSYSYLADKYAAAFSDLLLNIFEVAPIDEFKYFLLALVIIASITFGFLSGSFAVKKYLRIGGT